MAIFHCSVKIIGRSTGKSIVAAAAYRAGERLVDYETGLINDYTRKGGVVHSEISLPENASIEFLDRETLWNAVTKVESAADARFAREVEVALPIEFDRETQISVLREYIQEQFVSKGMIADWSIHDVDKENRNPHCHILLTTRGLKPNGEWDAKAKKVYKLDQNGERIPIIDVETGEQKIDSRGRHLWERESVKKNDWDAFGLVEEWRQGWANACNKHLVPAGIDPIDHRSYERQGIDKIPSIHEGSVAREIEERGGVSDRCEINREISKTSAYIKPIIEKINLLIDKVKEFAIDLFRKERGSFGKEDYRYEPFGRTEAMEGNYCYAEGKDGETTKITGTEQKDDSDSLLAELEVKECSEAEERANRKLDEVGFDVERDTSIYREGRVDFEEDWREVSFGKVDRGL